MNRFAIRLDARRLALAGFAAVAAVGAGSATPRFDITDDAASVVLPPVDARQLIEATTGEHLAETRATGDVAKLINAAMPFATGLIDAARPFDLPASDALDHRRALLCLTQAIYYEAGFEPVQGRRAVAQVVLNRMRHPAFPKSVCGVVYQGSRSPVCQFSFVCDGSLYRQPELGAWKQARAIAEAALSGYVERTVGAATFYHADYVAPVWAPRLAKLTQIGAHIFYRWPGQWGSTAAFSGRYVGEPNDPAALRPPLRPAVIETVDGVPVVEAPAGPITDGTTIHRAQNDVGGLLDTSKGWTLSIPLPGDSASAAPQAPPVTSASSAAAAPVAQLATR